LQPRIAAPLWGILRLQLCEDFLRVDKPLEHIVVVTISRPEVMNAINGAVTRELERVVEWTEAQDGVWVVILTGAGGRCFSAGADLREVSQGRLSGLWTPKGGFAGFVNASRTKVWIAAVEGMALAGGFELALACDFIVASEQAQFGLPEVTRGLLAAAGGAYRLARAIPRAVALELLATGRRLSAASALSLHLINRIAPQGEALEQALTLAREILANAPLAVRESLHIAREAFDHDAATLSRVSHEAQARLQKTQDFTEGPRAFLEKRAPVWKGR
jgi:enoyl-CoA hydratase/carnithine racemase